MYPSRTSGRRRVTALLLPLTVALAATVGALAAAPPALAQSVCNSDNPPESCFTDPSTNAGALTSVGRGPGTITVTGWARKVGTSAATVTITIGNNVVGQVVANQAGGPNGVADKFSATLPANYAGSVCATDQLDNVLGCGTAVSNTAYGSFDSATASGGTVSVTGWAIDPDIAGPVTVHVYQDGVFAGAFTADQSRPDVAGVYPAWGANHGFAATINQAAGDGSHSVCVYAINAGPGSTNPLLGSCRSYTAKHNPYGSLDQVSRSGTSVSVSGWAIDPDQPTTPIDVAVSTDGAATVSVHADGSRPDVANAYPDAGAAHGYATTVPANLTPGAHSVCVSALNVQWGTSVQLGCRSYTTPAPVVAPHIADWTSNWPFQPSGETSTLSSNQVTLSWTDSSTSTTDYRLERSDAGGPWQQVFRMSTSMRYVDNTNLTPGSQYCWRIVASNDVSSATSNEVCGTTLLGFEPSISAFSYSATDSSVTIRWTDNATDEDEYLVGIGPNPSMAGVTWVHLPAGSGQMSYTFGGLAAGTKYYTLAAPLKAGHDAWIGGVVIPVYTTGAPHVDSFTSSVTAIQACSPVGATLSWHTSAATRVVVKLGNTVLADRSQTNPDPWSDSVAAPAADGGQTYTLTAYSPDGRTVTQSLTVAKTSAYPLIHALVFGDTGWDSLAVQDVDLYGNVLKTYATLAPGQNTVVTLPNCSAHVIQLVDTSTGRVAWTSNAVILGYDSGAVYSYGVS